ncbi:BadF/BadG/BcrA/BcrD ATPase family protein [Pirellulimonas nuda]|uniref:BadF/BadG/BcrA/BcrD ATPase family protein n=1 Tax=Pirellulimonas nuda TaxID=2528009 RepID=A0A518DAJ0_9BACT|nr:BadF/BadG/BcrA/BcrD ATPase family protein [Pirellulimonas nuda]QDU88500.1 BadF/BadG/BcrA/BcrD ATPase family protein [Pirellulimonas nuda]
METHPVGAESRLLLAVDAGGTGTRATIARADADGQVHPLGGGAAGPGNPLSAGFDHAVEAIEAAIAEARRHAGCEQQPLDAALLAVAGAASGEMHRRVSEWGRQRRLAGRVDAVADWAPVLAAAGPGPALGIISGTGSVAIARGAAGAPCFAGGWGYLLGDDGSGYSLGRAAVRAVLAEAEAAAPASELAQSVLARFDASDVALVPGVIHRLPQARTQIASLASVVIGLAAGGDSRCLSLIANAAQELGEIGARAARRAGVAGGEVSLALAGGVLTHCEPLRDGVRRALLDGGVAVRGVEVVYDATLGGLLLAAAACDPQVHWRITPGSRK